MSLSRTIVIQLVFVAMLFQCGVPTRAAPPAATQPARVETPEVADAVEQAALHGQWTRLARELETVTSEQGNAVERVLKAHVSLATNRNNESFRLFASAYASVEDVQAWSAWTQGLVDAHPGNDLAHFYRADALVRQGRHQAALKRFAKAIELNGDNAFAHHGRGVVHVQLGQYDAAIKDLAKARRLEPKVADFHNSQAMLRVAQRAGGINSLESRFKRAAELSEGFALAHHGLGCAALLQGRNDEASKDFLIAKNQLDVALALFVDNELAYEMRSIERYAERKAQRPDGEQGTTIKREIELQTLTERYRGAEAASRRGQGLARRESQLRQARFRATMMDHISRMTPEQMRSLASKSPRLATDIRDVANDTPRQWNAGGGHQPTRLSGLLRHSQGTTQQVDGVRAIQNHVGRPDPVMGQQVSSVMSSHAMNNLELLNEMVGTRTSAVVRSVGSGMNSVLGTVQAVNQFRKQGELYGRLTQTISPAPMDTNALDVTRTSSRSGESRIRWSDFVGWMRGDAGQSFTRRGRDSYDIMTVESEQTGWRQHEIRLGHRSGQTTPWGRIDQTMSIETTDNPFGTWALHQSPMTPYDPDEVKVTQTRTVRRSITERVRARPFGQRDLPLNDTQARQVERNLNTLDQVIAQTPSPRNVGGTHTIEHDVDAVRNLSPQPAPDPHGGALIAKANVSWDDSSWPFQPIFGLAYPPAAASVPQATEPNGTQSPPSDEEGEQ